MSTQTLPKMATRHECMHKDFGSTFRHTSGAGAPKRKSCIYCGGMLTTLTGWWAVFVHSSVSGDNRYHVTSAQSLHSTERSASKVIDTDTTGTLVVRWVMG